MINLISKEVRSKILDWVLILALLFFISSTSYNYWYDSDQLPVVTQMEPVDRISYNKDMAVWSGKIQGVKQRNCVFIPNETVGLAKEKGKWQQVEFFFSDDPTPGDSKPVGFQSFDVWNWNTSKNATELKVLVKHVCKTKGEDKLVTTTIGPFSIQ